MPACFPDEFPAVTTSSGNPLSYESPPKVTNSAKALETKAGPLDPDTMAGMLADLHPAAFGWALACCNRDRTFAAEVSQMAYLKILVGEARYAGRSSFKTWLFGVIRHTAAYERRRAWLTFSRLARFARQRPDPPPAAGPETETAWAHEEARLLGALAHLSRRQREVLHLVFYEGLTLADAAAVLSISIGAVRVHYARGKGRLRAHLSRRHPNE
ncbi:MAG: RNA polymerase [Acidobacteria bacterium]|nr:MAG: RNA polymerase [Acidobacteriota bacterium]